MRKFITIAGLVTSLCLAVPSVFAAPAPAAKGAPATIVIVFKDGHRQTFNLAEIARVEFSGAADAAAIGSSSSSYPRHFIGKWEVGDGNGTTFYITLYDDGDAREFAWQQPWQMDLRRRRGAHYLG